MHPTRRAPQRPLADEVSGGRRQTHQDEMSQEEEEADNLGRQQGLDTTDGKVVLLGILTIC